jgi:DNA invertase Pin-like site-specific DNA recombinase
MAERLCTDVQRAFGGVGGFYMPVAVPVEQAREQRNERIRKLAGEGPYTTNRVKVIARELNCSVRTVWRALAEVAQDSAPTVP